MKKFVNIKGVGRVSRARVAKISGISRGISSSLKTIDAQRQASKKIGKYQSRKRIPVIGYYLAKRALK